ncbi:hypothetical protein [Clostridium sp.]|uniref:hypothetical protein n=1 Tax=Clostridium sp. TaxID=1506 RepID=UPI002907F05F|nr:hypothetical protein [Clostridium sp.]MDU3323779.1 hypothetical protein [Escherichia coli]MDU3411003.1 hypothetical protein [Clostridium sp.]
MPEKIEVSFQVGVIITAIATIISSIVGGIVSNRVAKKQRMIEIITNNRVKWMQDVKNLFSEYFTCTKYYVHKSIPQNNGEWFEKLNMVTSKIKLQLNLKGPKDKMIISLIDELNICYEKLLVIKLKNINSKDIEEAIDEEVIENYLHFYPKIKGLSDFIYRRENKNDKLLDIDSNVINREEYKEIAKNVIIMDLQICTKCIKNLPNLINIYSQIYLKCEWERVKKESKEGINTKFDFEKEFDDIEKEMSKEIKDIKRKLLYNEWEKYGRSVI